MTAHQEIVLWITCNNCGRSYPRSRASISDIRADARRNGWKTGKHPRSRHIPRYYDACMNCPLPEEYRKL